jgi:integrase
MVATLQQRQRHGPVIAEPKTTRSRRQVQLGSATVDALRSYRQAQPGIGFVFTRIGGRPLSRSIVDKAWTRINERDGVPSVRFLDLRHTAARALGASQDRQRDAGPLNGRDHA